MYNEKVMTAFKELKNVGGLQGANGVGKVENSSCGDIMKIYLKINQDGVIEEARFKTFGCVGSIASSSVVTELVKGKTIKEALEVKNTDIIEKLGELPNEKIYCSILAEEAIHSAIDDYYKKLEKTQKNIGFDEDDED